ncbi:RNA polymerase sigma factor [Sphingomonas canadensis]|uniref:RNA polymerase sigma factor n=1 Tax=Sphingomonas canadensis TaxID=1219257 RepID=A0ABW3H0S6_9SPHN|nr:sigma-70 family RNA polymerase sigma factor [Sphingomonas canadensis]MCW3835028.1 sigma-70 family RNA polymerase sigma factor [Sphingomonas canadensis]
MTFDRFLPPARLDDDDPLPPEDRAGSSATAIPMDALYRSQSPRLARFFARRTPRNEVADLVQESFRRLLGTGTRVERPEAYLSRIATNLVRDRASASARHHDAAHESYDDDAVAGPDPHQQLEARDTVARLEAALTTLKPKTREIFLMHRLDGLSYAEIADAKGMSIKGVEKQISQALYLLRRRVGAL